jgi:hypothetical protein
MADLYYVHWHEDEARVHAAELTAAGHAVRCHSRESEGWSMGERMPDVMVISLDRLPSHARQVAEWFWQAKKRRSIPMVFVGGAPEKAAALAARYPEAVFCAREQLAETLARLVTAS